MPKTKLTLEKVYLDLDSKINRLSTGLSSKIDVVAITLNNKIDTKIDSLDSKIDKLLEKASTDREEITILNTEVTNHEQRLLKIESRG